jgi:thioredoxin 1
MSKAGIQEITSSDFEGKVLKAKGLVLVEFLAPWCGPCQIMIPKVEKAAEKFAGDVNILKINIEKSPKLASKYAVLSLPTLIFFKNGKPIDQIGFLEDNQLMEKIQENISR